MIPITRNAMLLGIVTKEAGVTKKTIYMYFESKEELLKYFIQEEISNMEKIVEILIEIIKRYAK